MNTFDVDKWHFRVFWDSGVYTQLERWIEHPKDAYVRANQDKCHEGLGLTDFQRRLMGPMGVKAAEFNIASAMATQRRMTFVYVCAVIEALLRDFAQIAISRSSDARTAQFVFNSLWRMRWDQRLRKLFELLGTPQPAVTRRELKALIDARNMIVHDLAELDVSHAKIEGACGTALSILAALGRIARTFGIDVKDDAGLCADSVAGE